ncbi:hypothetical protein M5689_000103 [Euphorbia peplus]|nr:hypothetical protein M5689_000103 [Euphorbia peplus]
MDSQRKALLSFITIFLSLFLQSSCQAQFLPPTDPRGTPPLVAQLCAKVVGYEPFCITTFISDKRCWQVCWEAKTVVDLITKFFLPLVADHAQRSQTYIAILATRNHMTPEATMALHNCADKYETIFKDFKGAISDVERGNNNIAKSDISSAMYNHGLCIGALSKVKPSEEGIKEVFDDIDLTNKYLNITRDFINSLTL